MLLRHTSLPETFPPWSNLLQAFDAELFVADPGNLGGWALADALKLHKAVVQVPGFTPPLVGHVTHLLLLYAYLTVKQS